MWGQSLSLEDSLEEEMAPYSSILAWKIPWAQEAGGLVRGVAKELDTTNIIFILLTEKPSLRKL